MRCFRFLILLPLIFAENIRAQKTGFRAGAAKVDIAPQQFPVVVSGMFLGRKGTESHGDLFSRAVVLDDGETRIAIVIVDSLMIRRELLDEAKAAASKATGIPADRMLIAATHTHSAPSVMGALGTGIDENYKKFLPGKIVESIVQANANLQPARVGWGVVKDYARNHCRRWIFRPDRIGKDPFGQSNVRAMMHPGYQSPNHIGPAGPADPDLSLLAIQTKNGKPLAVLANYAMHYKGSPMVSGDVCGRFGPAFAKLIGADASFVGALSQGTSGDSMWMNYAAPKNDPGLDAYTEGLAETALKAWKAIKFRSDLSLAMAEAKLKLRRRVPDEERLAQSKETVAKLPGGVPRSRPEVYAREAIYLHEEPEVELKLQAVRIGDLGITTLPNEVYGLTGLKLKARSPLKPTFNIELANGAQGYIPPPEQHELGGYTTWPARTAGLEIAAESKIIETLLGLLEEVSGKKRVEPSIPEDGYLKTVRASKPVALWRFDDMDGTLAKNSIGEKWHGKLEPGFAFFLPGRSPSDLEFAELTPNRALQFAGGRMIADVPAGDSFTVEFWFWNGMPAKAREITGILAEWESGDGGERLMIGRDGVLAIVTGSEGPLFTGRTEIPLRTWNHAAVVRDGSAATVYLNGNPIPEIKSDELSGELPEGNRLSVGGSKDGSFNLEGKLDDFAFFDRALSAKEITAHFKAAGRKPKPQHPESPPKTPVESLEAIHVREGFKVELVAAEPLVQDPVAIAWGTDGRLWVAEMADYPMGMDNKGKSGGRIRHLEDTTGDGKFDRSTVFLEDLNFPTSVMPWRGGVLIAAAPDILYAEDTDGDGKANVSTVMFTGFNEGNQQLRVNGLRWGLDNWIYGASGGHHARYGTDRKVTIPSTGGTVDLGSRDFRFRPDEGVLDPQSGPSQFGRAGDDWGNWFGVQNSNPLWHYVLHDHYVRRNPHFAPPDPRRQLRAPANPEVFPAKPPQSRFHSFNQSGRFTSACSEMIYRDIRLFPEGESPIHAFTCEPFHNLVQHHHVKAAGVSFTSERAADDGPIDFFASEDRWCRPVFVRTGPDGALWVVDMYRYIIEHPQWLPQEGKDELKEFYRHGDDRGRIYRIVPKDLEAGEPFVRIDEKLKADELVRLLDTSNGTRRDLVSQEIFWRNDPAAAEPLEALFADPSVRPESRLAALCALDGLGNLAESTLLAGMKDEHPAIRIHSIRLTETREAESPALVEAACKLAADSDPKVRMQLACSLGAWKTPDAAGALAELIRTDQSGDAHFQAAAISSLREDNVGPVVAAIFAEDSGPPAGYESQLLSQAAAFRNQDAIDTVFKIVARPRADDAWTAAQLETAAALFDELARQKLPIDERAKALFAFARDRAFDSKTPAALRQAAVGLFGSDPMQVEADLRRLGELLDPANEPAIQNAAAARLASRSESFVPGILLKSWDSHAPALRTRILTALVNRKTWVPALVDACESNQIALTELDAATRQRLEQVKDTKLKPRIRKLLGNRPASRADILKQFAGALKLKPNLEAGAVVFQQRCATCHRHEEIGFEVGPNLASLTDRRPQSLLAAIIDPSEAIDPRYLAYTVLTRDGRTLAGILSGETGSSMTVAGPAGLRETILRADIEKLQATKLSLMPPALEQGLTLQQMADLIGFISKEPGK